MSDRRLWFAVLGAPVAWAIQLAVNYSFEDGIACTRGARTPGQILGASTDLWIVAVSAVLALVTLAALATSVTAYRRLRTADNTTGRRAEWMAFAGIVNSAVFLIPIVLALVPPFVLRTCHSVL